MQVLYGESLLTMLFPDLVLDTDCETCPDCQAKLPASAIQSGWYARPTFTFSPSLPDLLTLETWC